MSDAADRAAVAERAAEAGGAVARSLFRGDLTVETKANETDYVTRADREAQAEIVDVIGERYPNEPVVGEEDGAAKAVPERGPAWVVDPIDGSHNYVRGGRVWGTCVAAVRDGEPVAAATVCPALGDAYVAGDGPTERNGEVVSVSERADPATCSVAPTVWWPSDRRDEFARAAEAVVTRFGDLRRPGSVQVALAQVAAGRLDGAITNVAVNPWDSLAGVHLVRRAGGRVTDIDGDRWHHDATGLVASNGAVHDAVLAAAADIGSAP
ncbi:inositol monophosphatase [Halosimplex rubrum]|uniref:fructose-bisphosphatase n=1 Tax=Halosimplex rubrum TaxID=869889 RepID=A0A7D5TJM0_9EURY|nr:inositol monophosphatase [Halosimplex rubrum]QLH76072.1 inositol monophosphatase [Halosimplex rubrum]